MNRNYFWKVVIQEEKVALATSNISYGTNYYSRVIICYDFSTDPSLLYKGLQITLRGTSTTLQDFTETSTHKNTVYSLNLHEAFA